MAHPYFRREYQLRSQQQQTRLSLPWLIEAVAAAEDGEAATGAADVVLKEAVVEAVVRGEDIAAIVLAPDTAAATLAVAAVAEPEEAIVATALGLDTAAETPVAAAAAILPVVVPVAGEEDEVDVLKTPNSPRHTGMFWTRPIRAVTLSIDPSLA